MNDLVTPEGEPLTRYDQIKVPNIEIVGPRIMVIPRPKRTYKSEQGVIVPDFAQDDFQEGVVVLAGDGVRLPNGEQLPPRVKQGDAIIYARYAGAELKLDQITYLIVNETDIRCVLTYVGPVFSVEPDDDA